MTHADLVLQGGPVFTGDGWASALAVRGARVVAVGTERDLSGSIGPGTRVVSLAGRTAVPGFHDAHTHLLGGALAEENLDLSAVGSRAELSAAVAAWVQARGVQARAEGPAGHARADWVLGRGWDADRFPGGELPRREDLDAVAPDVPVLLRRRDGHAAVANSRALALGGIGRETPDPPGGRIVRDPGGEPTGLLLEQPAFDPIERRVPPWDRATREQALAAALARAVALGITSLQDDPSFDEALEAAPTYAALHARGALPLRVTLWRRLGRAIDDLRAEERALAALGVPPARLRFGLLKGYLDGSLGSRTALLFAPYADDPQNQGVDLDEAGRLMGDVAAAHAAGYQVGLHAIGDLAVARALDAFEAAPRVSPSSTAPSTTGAGAPATPDNEALRERRHRVEHAQVLRARDVDRLARLGAVASVQPIHLASDLRIASARLGAERARWSYCWASLQAAGAQLAFGSDYPVEPLDPLPGIACALTRCSPREPELPAFHPEEALSLEDALRAYTLGPAIAAHQEHELGRLAPGYLADVAVLSRDLTTAPPEELHTVRCLLTLRDGEVVFEREGA